MGIKKNIRFIVYGISMMVALLLYVTSSHRFLYIYETQWYGIVSFILLYFTLLPSPLYAVFPQFPYKQIYVKARKALGVSSFFFALIHSYLGFFQFVGGFEGLQFWSSRFAWSLFIGFISLLILTVLAITSLKYFIKRLGKYWKVLHRSIYVAGVLILIHGVTVTIHIINLQIYLVIAYIFLTLLFTLEAIRLDKHLNKYKHIPSYSITKVLLPIAVVLLFWSFFFMNHHTH